MFGWTMAGTEVNPTSSIGLAAIIRRPDTANGMLKVWFLQTFRGPSAILLNPFRMPPLRRHG